MTNVAADNQLSGGAGDDLIMGKKGDDWLEGGLGDDTLVGGHGDDTFIFTDADFDGNGWTDVIDGQGQNGKAGSDYDTIDLTGVSQGWTLEIDGAGAGAEATNLSSPAQYAESGGEFSGTITFDDGSTIAFENIEKVDW
jgi:Ca2+-binding RTX toxin-like protein